MSWSSSVAILAEYFSNHFNMAPKPSKAASIAKKPAAAHGKEISTVEEFADVFEPLCYQQSCLPYPQKGGRQSHLAISSKRWVHAMRDEGGGLQTIKKKLITPGFLEIHKRRKHKDEIGWALPDNQSESWAIQMGKRLGLLKRHISQAMDGDRPQWLAMVFDDTHMKKESADDGDGAGPRVPAETQVDSENEEENQNDEEGEEEEPEGPEDPEQEQQKEPANEQHHEHLDDAEKYLGTIEYIADYSHEAKKAFRVKAACQKKAKDFTEEYECDDDDEANDPVTAVWPDGWRVKIAKLTCGEVWPQHFEVPQEPVKAAATTSKVLPNNSAKKKKKGGGGVKEEKLWELENSVGARHYIQWRSSRGWQVSLYNAVGGQICQAKVQCYVAIDEGKHKDVPVEDRCVAMMINVAKDYMTGDVKHILLHRDSLLQKHGLAEIRKTSKNKGAVADAPGIAATEAVAAAPEIAAPAIAATKRRRMLKSSGDLPAESAPLATSLTTDPAAISAEPSAASSAATSASEPQLTMASYGVQGFSQCQDWVFTPSEDSD